MDPGTDPGKDPGEKLVVSALVAGDGRALAAAAASLGDDTLYLEATESTGHLGRRIRAGGPDAVVLDTRHPDVSGDDRLAGWLERFPAVVAVLVVDDDAAGLHGVRAGAQDYLLREELGDRLLLHVLRCAVARGGIQRRVRDEHARFRSLIERSADRVTVIDPGGTILYESPAVESVLGYPADGLVGRNAFELIHPADAQPVRDTLQDLLHGSSDFRMTRARIRSADGEWRVLELRGIDALDDPAIGGVVVNSRDVTETIELEDQLRQAQKMEAIGRLASGVAHDFNNLLTSIGGFASLARTSVPDDHPAHLDLDEIERATTRASELTRQLLTFSRKQPARPARLDLNRTLEVTERMITRLIGEDIVVRFDPCPDPAPTVADPGQVEQVIMNLVVNARDAMPNGGELRIGVERVRVDDPLSASHGDVPPGEYSVVSVSDTGAGMPAGVRRRVFEPFFSTKAAGEGTGLGLSMVWGIMSRHGGTVHVYSEPGEGTVFRLYFPAPRESDGDADQPPAERAVVEGGTERILVVEDDPQVRRYACRVLADRGYAVLEAESMPKALERIARQDEGVDLLITDVIMPGGSGTELTRELRRTDPGLPVLFVSGYAEERVSDRGMLDEKVPFIEKPFTPDVLLAKVRSLLERRPR